MIGAIRSEVRKLLTTRIWWILVLVMMAYLLFTASALLLAFHFSSADQGQVPTRMVSRMVYALAPAIAYVFPALAGTLTITTESRHHTMEWTVLAEPRRPVILAAKLLVGLGVGIVYGIAAVMATIGAGAGILAALGKPTGLTDASTIEIAGRTILALALWAAVGVGFGAVLNQQVAAIIVLLVFTQFLEPMLRFLPIMLERSIPVLKYLPGAAGEGIAGDSLYTVAADAGVPLQTLTIGPASVTLLTYAVIFAGLGYFLTFRRDIT
jgi:hypothetical protein